MALLCFASCKKTSVSIADLPHKIVVSSDSSGYIKYSIAQGAQYCDKSTLTVIKYQQLAFRVKFDSSAIYSTTLGENQYDINKLYGFSDNNLDHHQFSARFGWRWSNDSLRLFGYIYNNGIRSDAELGTIAIGSENNCMIKVTATTYVFVLNEKETVMPRASTTAMAEGYKLFPYFGGDEMAPHAISIWIQDL